MAGFLIADQWITHIFNDWPISAQTANNWVMNLAVTGMFIQGDGHVIEGNVIAHNLWTGSYQGRSEKKNVDYSANFELVDAGDITVKDNIVC